MHGAGHANVSLRGVRAALTTFVQVVRAGDLAAHLRRYFFEAAICRYPVGLHGLMRIRAIYAADQAVSNPFQGSRSRWTAVGPERRECFPVESSALQCGRREHVRQRPVDAATPGEFGSVITRELQASGGFPRPREGRSTARQSGDSR